ncbi:DUF1206 domain-containing protein [Maribacter sp. 2210JD10-5]|uniref:DUF1206 domain-containing protein n=1 Tax=Maribacter sp. 2210JD10-5 TaxID=3386272 RepID=UPI0039BCBD27
MKNQIKRIAKIGYFSKGVVYALTGFLAFGAAFGLGGKAQGKMGVLAFLKEQSFGNVLLGLIGTGLICYAFWRFFQSIKDPENIGSDTSGLGKRIGFFLSGLLYFSLGIYAFYTILGQSGNGAGNSSFIPSEITEYVFYAIGIGLVLKAIFQFKKAYKGDFIKKFDSSSLSKRNIRKAIKNFGYAGLIARGIVVAIISYFFLRAASTAGSLQSASGTQEAFDFLGQNSEGPWLVGIVALGLICYGIFMFMMAKYRAFDTT